MKTMPNLLFEPQRPCPRSRRTPLDHLWPAGLLLVAILRNGPAFGQTGPSNDLFSNAIVITNPQAIVTGSNVGATKEPGEPNHAGNAGGQSVWWTWTAPTNGTVTIDTTGSSFDTLLAVYTGDSVSNLSPVASNDDVSPNVISPALNVASTVTFSAVAGTAYQIAVDGYAVSPFSRDSGDIVLGLWEGAMPPRIDTQPQDVTVPEGGVAGAYFQVNVSGTTPFGWQWFKDGVPIPSGSPLFPFRFEYQFGNAQLTNAGTYSVVVTNAGGSATSSNTVLTVLPVAFVAQPLVPPGTPQPQSKVVSAGYPVAFGAGAKSLAAVSYQWLKDGQPILGATNSTFTIANVQPGDAALYKIIASNALGSVTSSNAPLTVLPPYTFVTLAGLNGAAGSNDGPGITARFNYPYGIAVDGAGTVYVGDGGNYSIRKITPAGVVSTVARLGSSGSPYLAVASDGATNVYVADSLQRTISKISPDGSVSLVAGRAGVSGKQDGTNSAALFGGPTALALDAAGNLFVSDQRSIRKITPEGLVTTVAPGIGAGSYGPDGRWTKANLGSGGIGVDQAGRIFVADSFGAIRVIASGQVNTVAGLWNYPGHLDGSGSAARLAPAQPSGAAMDTGGNFYMVESPRGRSVRRITPRGDVTTLAGPSGVGDGTGAAAGFGFLGGIAVDRAGNLYVADWGSHVIKKGVPFAITAWPQSQAVIEGANVTLNAEAVGPNGPFSYQWQFAGAPLAGETNATLSLELVVRTNSGVYSVVVSNAVGNGITLNATVRALVPPVLQPPQLVTDLTATNRTLRLFFQDADGGAPFDLSQLALQWRTSLPSGTDTNWQTLTAGFYLTNGVVAVDDTNAVQAPTGFYRILER